MILKILATVFTLSGWINRACGQFQVNPVLPQLQPWGLSRGCSSPVSPPSIKPSLLQSHSDQSLESVCEDSIRRARSHEGRGRRIGGKCIYLFYIFLFCTFTQLLIFLSLFFSLMWITWSWLARIKKGYLCFYWKLWWLTMNWVAWCLSNGVCKW